MFFRMYYPVFNRLTLVGPYSEVNYREANTRPLYNNKSAAKNILILLVEYFCKSRQLIVERNSYDWPVLAPL